MTQILTDAPAQIQSNAAGPLVPAAVDARIPVFKDSGQVFFINSDTTVFDMQGIFFVEYTFIIFSIARLVPTLKTFLLLIKVKL